MTPPNWTNRVMWTGDNRDIIRGIILNTWATRGRIWNRDR